MALLRRVSLWLKDDGRLLIGVPNAKSFHRLAAVKMGLLSNEYELNERDVALGHYRVYDLNSLTAHAEEAGLEVMEKGGVFLKFLSNAQIEEFFTEEMMEAFNSLSKEFYFNSAEVFIVCKNKNA